MIVHVLAKGLSWMDDIVIHHNFYYICAPHLSPSLTDRDKFVATTKANCPSNGQEQLIDNVGLCLE